MSNRAVREGVVERARYARVPGTDVLRARQCWYPRGIVWTSMWLANDDVSLGHFKPKKASDYFIELHAGCYRMVQKNPTTQVFEVST